jgi:hypothetical protein
MSSSYNFFDPDQPVEEYYGCLPHWRQEGAIYFVTFRTASQPFLAYGTAYFPPACTSGWTWDMGPVSWRGST